MKPEWLINFDTLALSRRAIMRISNKKNWSKIMTFRIFFFVLLLLLPCSPSPGELQLFWLRCDIAHGMIVFLFHIFFIFSLFCRHIYAHRFPNGRKWWTWTCRPRMKSMFVDTVELWSTLSCIGQIFIFSLSSQLCVCMQNQHSRLIYTRSFIWREEKKK